MAYPGTLNHLQSKALSPKCERGNSDYITCAVDEKQIIVITVYTDISLYACFAGTSASDVNFQAYLLEGLARWNTNREAATIVDGTSQLQCYSSAMLNTVNNLSQKVLGKKQAPPGK